MNASEFTAPVRIRDRKIDNLADLVRDLIAIGPETRATHPGVLFCRWCIGVGTSRDGVAHELDCPIPRAFRALKGM